MKVSTGIRNLESMLCFHSSFGFLCLVREKDDEKKEDAALQKPNTGFVALSPSDSCVKLFC